MASRWFERAAITIGASVISCGTPPPSEQRAPPVSMTPGSDLEAGPTTRENDSTSMADAALHGNDATSADGSPAQPQARAWWCSRASSSRCSDFCVRTESACLKATSLDGESCRASGMGPCLAVDTAWCMSWRDPEVEPVQSHCSPGAPIVRDFDATRWIAIALTAWRRPPMYRRARKCCDIGGGRVPRARHRSGQMLCAHRRDT